MNGTEAFIVSYNDREGDLPMLVVARLKDDLTSELLRTFVGESARELYEALQGE